jgi:hypothetical protein
MATEFKGTNNEKNTLGKFMNSLGLQIETEKEGISQNEQDRNVGDGCSLLLEPSELVVDDEDLLHFRIRTRLLPILLELHYSL